MQIYFSEIQNGNWKYFSIDHDKRHLFWKEHPAAKEVSKKEYFEMRDFSLSQKENIEDKK